MTSRSVPRQVAAAAVLASTVLLLTGCSSVLSGTEVDRDLVAAQVDLPSGIPDDATAFDYLARDSTAYVSWEGGRVEDPSCTADGSSVPDLPDVVTRGEDVDGAVERCDFGHQVTSGSYTYVWMDR